MNFLDNILILLKLPLKIIVLLAIILGLLLFLPKNLQEILKLDLFINEYGKYIGIAFLFSIGYLVFVFSHWIMEKIFSSYKNKENIKKLESEILNLSQPSIFLLREFFFRIKKL